MKTRFLFLLCFATMVTTSCRKEQTRTEKLSATLAASAQMKAAIVIDPAIGNPQNPFDYTGAIHNEGLKALIDYVYETRDTTRSGKAKFLQSFLEMKYKVTVNPVKDPRLEKMLMKNYKVAQATIKMSAQARRFLSRMNICLDGISSLDGYDQFRQEIIAIEKDILASSLTELESNSLLVSASVMRHSAYFWFNFANTNGKAEAMGLLRKIAGVITGIAADATSALFYVFRRADIFTALYDTIEMSEICGIQTGGFSYW